LPDLELITNPVSLARVIADGLAMRSAIASKMREKSDSRTRLGVVAIIVCTFALWLILGGSAELARLVAGAAVAIAAGFWAALDAG
jgi:hypothetical protein